MKRFAPIIVLAILVPALTSIVLAQQPSQATLRTAAGDRPVTTVQMSGQTYFSAGDVITALGGTIAPDSTGFRVTLNNTVAAFGPDSRFGVVRDDLIEMPAPPVIVDGKPYVPWQFFHGFLKRAIDNEAAWDPAGRVLAIRSAQHNVVSVQASVTNVQDISKVVLTLSGPAEYGIVRQPGVYTIAFRTPIHAPFAEQGVEDPYVQKLAFAGNELRIQLSAPDVVGDAYKLENPFRIVLDFRKGSTTAPGTMPPSVSRPVDQPGIHTIVIDPGHGGKEVGAIGPGGMMEKDATLAVCRKLAVSLGAKLGARVVLTRDEDAVVSLDQRTAIANQYKADLFLSVHMNAAVVKGAHGSETYFLSLDASDELAKKAAEAENAVSAAAQPTASSDLKLILWDLAQQEYLNESSKFASAIQEEMNRATGVQNRGVKQAPFKVLVGATMPAALVEVAFITNPEEEAKLKKDDFQNMVVEAITRAVQRYKTDYEMRIGVAQPPAAAPPAPAAKPAPAPPATATAAARTGT
jgi:N-acetylmuramoyl-L-alanine amidase